MTISPINLPYSPACDRNKEAILNVISPYLSRSKKLLEVGSGSAQHAVYFSAVFPELIWQTSDQCHYLDGIKAQLHNASLNNVLPPVELDVNQKNWGFNGQLFDAIYTANTFHIMSQSDVDAFFQGLSDVVTDSSFLFVYGPFKYAGNFTSDSNRDFDHALRSRDCGSSIKDFEDVNALASQQGFKLVEDRSMPANNQCLVWQKL
ncbi:MAG: DUF938 domain-containing protein [Arenicella sp.]